MTVRLFPELPLLRRELTELAARKRTYVLRMLAAVLLVGVSFVVLRNYMGFVTPVPGSYRNITLEMLGLGEQVFLFLVQLLCYSVWLFMPSLVCGAISIEKERNTLGTLFVTRLSPLTIILEKLGSRLIPMLSFITLSFPILAWLYSLGGVEYRLVGLAIWILIWESILFASIGLMCSAWYPTTVAAFIASYTISGVLVLCTYIMRLPLPIPSAIWMRQQQLFGSSQMTLSSFAFADYINLYFSIWPTFLASGAFLWLAKHFLVTRAEVSRRSLLLQVFRMVDRFFQELNEVTTGGRMVVSDRISLPKFDPVAWRERSRKSFGKPQYLLRILLVLELPVLLICIVTVTLEPGSNLSSLLLLMWFISVFAISVKAATLISSERNRETLDALLSTPMTGSEILRQKIQGMRRLMYVLCVPILTVHFSSLLMAANISSVWTRSGFLSLLQVAAIFSGMVMATWVPMQLLAWVSLRFGLRGKTQTRSIVVTQLMVGLWFVLTIFVIPWLSGSAGYMSAYYRAMNVTSLDTLQFSDIVRWSALPTFQLALRPDGAQICCQHLMRGYYPYTMSKGIALWGPDTGVYFVGSPLLAWLQLVVVILFQGLICWLLRRSVCHRADKLLNRVATHGGE